MLTTKGPFLEVLLPSCCRNVAAQQPAVVLRSHFNFVRALLGVTMLAVVGLTIAVVIVANDGDEVGSPAAVRPIESIEYGGFNPATGRPDAAPPPEAVSPGSGPAY